jgi:hypothetical protein
MSGNALKRLRALAPADPLLVGTAQGSNGDGTTDVVMIGGGRVRVSGDAALGQRVFVHGGRILSEAPQLAAQDVLV